MSERDILKVKAAIYDDVAKYTKVINFHEFEYYMWIELDPDKVRGCYMYDCYEVVGNEHKPVMPDAFKYESPAWVKADTRLLNNEIGQHQYKLCFVDKVTDVSFSYFISYIVQNDNPYKPYVYMDR